MAADATYQPKTYRRAGGDETVIANGGKLIVESGGTIEVESGGVMTIADGAFAVGDLALTTGSIILGTAGKGAALDAKADGAILIGNGTTAAMQTLNTDVTMTNTGAVTIANDAVTYAKMQNVSNTDRLLGRDTAAAGDVEELTLSGGLEFTGAGGIRIADAGVSSAKLANGAGVAALLTAGLGGSASVLKTDTLTHTIVAAHGSKDRACIVMVVVDETYAVGTGTLPALVIGEADTTNKFMAAGTLDTEAAGTVLFFAGTNTATKAITATSTAAVGNSTGGCSITVLAIPTT